jgi:hypothetical protein
LNKAIMFALAALAKRQKAKEKAEEKPENDDQDPSGKAD